MARGRPAVGICQTGLKRRSRAPGSRTEEQGGRGPKRRRVCLDACSRCGSCADEECWRGGRDVEMQLEAAEEAAEEALEEETWPGEHARVSDAGFVVLFAGTCVAYCYCWLHVCDTASVGALLAPPETQHGHRHPPRTLPLLPLQPALPLLRHSPLLEPPRTVSAPVSSPVVAGLVIAWSTVALGLVVMAGAAKCCSSYAVFLRACHCTSSALLAAVAVYCVLHHHTYPGVVLLCAAAALLLCRRVLAAKFQRSAAVAALVASVARHSTSLALVASAGAVLALLVRLTWIVLLSQIYYKWEHLIRFHAGTFADPGMLLVTAFSLGSGAYLADVVCNITLLALSGMYASWYWRREISFRHTRTAVKNALLLKAGSACFASFFVSVSELLTLMHSILLAVFFVKRTTCLEKKLALTNSYVLTYVALSDLSIVGSVDRVSQSLGPEPWAALQKDDIVNHTLQICSFTISLLTAVVCHLYLAHRQPGFGQHHNFTILFPLFGFLLALEMCRMAFLIFTAGNNTLIVALKSHPEVANRGVSTNYRSDLLHIQEQWPTLNPFI